MRNQIARNIDVMLNENPKLQPPLSHRKPELSCFVLLTPEIFKWCSTFSPTATTT